MRQFARALLAAGVTKGSSVALMLANRPEFVIAAYGAGSIGAVVVPVSTFAPSDERDYILRHSDACGPRSPRRRCSTTASSTSCSTATPSSREGVPGRLRSTAFPFLRRIVSLDPATHETVERWDDLVARADEVSDELLDAVMADVHPHDPGIIIYTSGTSANPKGVLHTNGTPVIQSWRWGKALGLTPDDKLLSKFPYFWSAGLTMTLGGPLSAGTTVITIESFDAGTALEIMERERVTALQSMPETYNEIVEHPDFAHARPVGADPRRRRRAACTPRSPTGRGAPRPTATASPRPSRSAPGPSRRRRAASSAPSTAGRCPAST